MNTRRTIRVMRRLLAMGLMDQASHRKSFIIAILTKGARSLILILFFSGRVPSGRSYRLLVETTGYGSDNHVPDA